MGRPKKVVSEALESNPPVAVFDPTFELRYVARDIAVAILRAGRGMSDGVIEQSVKGALDLYYGVLDGVREREKSRS